MWIPNAKRLPGCGGCRHRRQVIPDWVASHLNPLIENLRRLIGHHQSPPPADAAVQGSTFTSPPNQHERSHRFRGTPLAASPTANTTPRISTGMTSNRRHRHRAHSTYPARLRAAARHCVLFIARQVLLTCTNDLIHQVLTGLRHR